MAPCSIKPANTSLMPQPKPSPISDPQSAQKCPCKSNERTFHLSPGQLIGFACYCEPVHCTWEMVFRNDGGCLALFVHCITDVHSCAAVGVRTEVQASGLPLCVLCGLMHSCASAYGLKCSSKLRHLCISLLQQLCRHTESNCGHLHASGHFRLSGWSCMMPRDGKPV